MEATKADSTDRPCSNVYRLIERGSVSGPFLVTDDFGVAGRSAMEHTSRTGRYVYIYDRAGFRGQTKKVKRGKETVAVSIAWIRQ